MATITFYGSSDDLIEVEGPLAGCDEYPGDDENFVVTGIDGALRVRVLYTPGGVWAIAAAPFEEDRPMLPVKISGHPNGYSACAIISGADMIVREAA